MKDLKDKVVKQIVESLKSKTPKSRDEMVKESMDMAMGLTSAPASFKGVAGNASKMLRVVKPVKGVFRNAGKFLVKKIRPK
jgi:hypothetical protein